MSKTNPQTIADLSISYTFTDYESGDSITQKQQRLSKDNKDLVKYKIKGRNYTFHVNDSVFDFDNRLTSFVEFIEWINFELVYLKIPLPLELDRFELLSENTFRIHVKP